MRTLFSKGLSALLIKVGAAGLTFVMFVLFSNTTDQAEYGRFAIGFSLAITLSMIAGLGLGTAVLRYYPQYHIQKQAALEHGFLKSATFASIVAPVMIAVLMVLALLLFQYYAPATNTNYLYATALLLIVMTFAEFAASALRAFGYTTMALAPRDIIWRVLGCGFALMMFWQSYRLSSPTILYFLASSLALIVVWQFWISRGHFVPALRSKSPAFNFPDWKKTIAPMWGASALYAFAQQFDIVVVGYFLSSADAASYFAALRTAGLLSLLLVAGNLISAPLISKYHHSQDKAGLEKMVRMLSAGIAVPTLLGFGMLALVGQLLLSLFNPAFVEAYYVLLILGVGFTFDAVAGPTGYMLQMVGHERTYLKIMGLTYVCVLVTQAILAPIWGAYGVAVPSALGLILANILIVHKVRRILGIDPSLFGLFVKVRSDA